MELGPIDDNDRTWVNGVEVGAHAEADQWNVPRKYDVAGDLVHPGRNVIVVQVLDTGRQGGIGGQPEQMGLVPIGGSNEAPLSLAGPWHYRVGAPYREL